MDARELADVKADLHDDLRRLREEIANAEAGLADLIRDSGDGAGDDQADAGSKTFEREHEMSLANNARDMVEQVLHALQRIDSGTYGICESCGNPIGKLRLQAFPRATLCMSCKKAEERALGDAQGLLPIGGRSRPLPPRRVTAWLTPSAPGASAGPAPETGESAPEVAPARRHRMLLVLLGVATRSSSSTRRASTGWWPRSCPGSSPVTGRSSCWAASSS